MSWLRMLFCFLCLGVLLAVGLLWGEATSDPPHKEKCYTCHQEESAFKEWQLSGHAKALTNLRKDKNAADSCLSCHSSGARVRRDAWSRGPLPRTTLEEAVNQVSCSSCHLHSSDREHYLVASPLTLCLSCHRMDCGCAGKGLIHQSQAEMYMGYKGKGVSMRPSPHREVVEQDCVGCHMAKSAPKEEVVKTGGHTFKATYDVCLQCHGNVMPRVEQNKRQIGVLLEEVNAALERLPEDSEAYKTIQHNRDMVVRDGGYGVHNFAYAESLLRYALKLAKEEMEKAP